MKRHEYILESSKVLEDKNIAICSDFHFNQKTPFKKPIDVLETLEDIKPTHIVIPGDLYDVSALGTEEYLGFYENPEISSFIDNATDIADVFFVKGDAEQRSKLLPYKLYNNYNPRFHLLCEKNRDGKFRYFNNNGINIAGIDLPLDYYHLNERERAYQIFYEYQRYLEKLSKYCGSQNFNVLLCHDPIIAKTLQEYLPNLNFDLIISGHNHGGIHPNSLKALLQTIESNIKECNCAYTKGMISLKDSSMVISEGITRYDSTCGGFQVLETFHEGTVENVRVLRK